MMPDLPDLPGFAQEVGMEMLSRLPWRDGKTTIGR